VVVVGFQGITNTAELEITTLGRGGSDTSAVALAAALGANCCEIYTDVPDFNRRPRLVPDAQLMAEITCDEIGTCQFSEVLHPRAEIARNYGVELVVCSSWTEDPGTRVSQRPSPALSSRFGDVRPAVEFDTDKLR